MSDYVINKKDMKFQSQDALKTVQAVIDDADAALNDKSRRMKEIAETERLFEILVGHHNCLSVCNVI